MAEVVTLNENSIRMGVGGQRILRLSIVPEEEGTVTWNSSNAAIASVDDGKVIGKTSGTTTITAVFGNLSATCTVKVEAKYKLVSLSEAKERLSIDFDDQNDEIESRISSIMAYIENATGISEKDFGNLENSVQNLAKDYVLKSLYYDYYDQHTELNDRRLTMIMKQLQLVGGRR